MAANCVNPAASGFSGPIFQTAPAASAFFSSLFGAVGDGDYFVGIRGERVVSFRQAEPETTMSANEGEFLDMRAAAAFLRHGYHWLSRHWKRLGLRPHPIGKILLFHKKDLEEFLGSTKVGRGPGRPRTHRGA